MIIPTTNQGIIEAIINTQRLSVNSIAKLSRLATNTVYAARKGVKGSWPTSFKLLMLYIELNSKKA